MLPYQEKGDVFACAVDDQLPNRSMRSMAVASTKYHDFALHVTDICQYETNVEQLNQNFCLRLHQELYKSTKNFWGGMPPDPPRKLM